MWIVPIGYILSNNIGWCQENSKKEFVLKGWEYAVEMIRSGECNYTIKQEQKWYEHPPSVSKPGFFKKEDYEKVPYTKEKKETYNCCWKYKRGKEVVEYIKKTYEKGQGKIYCDGEKYVEIQDKQILITPVGIQNLGIYSVTPPSSVLFHFWPGVSVKKIFSSGKIELKKVEYVNNQKCYPLVYRPSDYKDIGYTFWISEENFLPAKIETKIGSTITIVSTISYTKIGDIWFPQKFIGYTDIKGEKNAVVEIEYTNIKVNNEISDKIFEPEFQPGMNVYDRITNTIFTVPEKK